MNSKIQSELPNRIIGGMFGFSELKVINKISPPFYTGRELFFSNARSCINFLAKTLMPGKIWIPSYLCEVILQSISGFSFEFYEIDRRLQISRDWLDDVKKDDMVLFIDYFGFPFDASLSKVVKELGAWVIEDASQALLSDYVGKDSDFVIFSPRKFLGVPEGGILRNNTSLDFWNTQLKEPPAEWYLKSFFAAMYRSEFDRFGVDKKWYQLFQEIERDSPIGDFAMGELTRIIIEYCSDYSEIIRTRISNYEILNGYLNKMALFPVLTDGIVPLGFPILLRDRNKTMKKLFDKKIFPPIHWRIKSYVPEKYKDSHMLSETILTLICDQRYGANDMKKIAEIVLNEEKL